MRSVRRPQRRTGVRADVPARIRGARRFQGPRHGPQPVRVAMAVPLLLTPKKPAWFAASLAATAAALLVYAAWAWWAPWRAGRAGGLTFGTIAALVFLID